MAPPWAPDVFKYLDFKEFLRDYYSAGRAGRPGGFSYRLFSARIGYTSSGTLPALIDGRHRFDLKRLAEVCEGMGLDEAESQYFEVLVRYGQCDDEARKPELLERLQAMQRYQRSAALAEEHFQFLAQWHYPAIREMVACRGFVEDPTWIGARLQPPIDAEIVEVCLKRLLAMRLLRRDEEGALALGEPEEQFQFTGHEARIASGTSAYHHEMLRLAADARRLGSEQRHLNALTLGIRRSQIPELKRRINQFLETSLAFCAQEEVPPDEVYQLHVALFPLTQIGDQSR
jgi:uncharacterized protein (TIGR02147 family)